MKVLAGQHPVIEDVAGDGAGLVPLGNGGVDLEQSVEEVEEGAGVLPHVGLLPVDERPVLPPAARPCRHLVRLRLVRIGVGFDHEAQECIVGGVR